MAKINLIEALKRVDKSTSNSPPWEEVCEDLNISYSYQLEIDEDTRLKCFPVIQWCCTDTWVGLEALYLDDELVGMTWQEARRSTIDIKWISQEAANKTRNYILSLTPIPDSIALIGADEEIDEFYSVAASSRISNDGFYQGHPARALIWYDWHRQTTPMEYRRGDRAYTINVPYESEKKDMVEIEILENKDRLLVHINDFVQRINVV